MARAIYLLALRLLPQRFRARYSADSEGDVLAMIEESRAASVIRRSALWLRAAFDVAMAAPGLHWRERMRRRPRSRSTKSPALREIGQDVRYAIRVFTRQLGFSTVAVLTLAMGIGAATTIFGVANAVLLRRLPYAAPDRLINVWNDFGHGAQSLPAVSASDWRIYQRTTTRFVDFAAATGASEMRATGIVSSFGSAPERVTLGGVSANFFPLLGVQPIHGRQFNAAEEVLNGPRVVMLSNRFWQRRFGGDARVVGQMVDVDGVGHTIVGVLPASFRLYLPDETYALTDSDVWKPLQIDWSSEFARNITIFTVFGRLKPNVTLTQAQAELDAVATRLNAENPKHAVDLKIRAIPLHADVVKGVKPTLLLLLGAVAVLVAIAGANVAGMLLARASTREREMAIRLAIGASRWRLIRQLLAESAVLVTLAGPTGLAIAYAGLRIFESRQPLVLPQIGRLGIDWTAVLFVLALLIVVTLLCGLAPALYGTSASTVSSGVLRSGKAGSRVRQHAMRNALIGVEVALSVVLLVCAGLLIRSLDRLSDVKPGFVAGGTLSFQVALPSQTFPSFKERRTFTGALLERLRAIPGVTVAGASSALPLAGLPAIQNYAYDDESIRNWGNLTAERISVTRDYFRAAGIRLVAGEPFSATPVANGATVVIIDEDIARKAWPNENAIGKRIQVFRVGTAPDPFATIVGVAEHIRSNDLRERGRPQIYWSYEDRSSQAMNYVVRTTMDAERLVASVRAAVADVDPSVPLTRVMPLGGYVAQALSRPRFATVLMQIVGGFSLFLATIGLYGVIAFLVGQRTHEFGIRLAMGATPNRLRAWVVVRGSRLVVVSAIVGLALSPVVANMLRSMLYEVSPYDPITLIGVCVLIATIAAIACYVPARRASRTSPLEALRAD